MARVRARRLLVIAIRFGIRHADRFKTSYRPAAERVATVLVRAAMGSTERTDVIITRHVAAAAVAAAAFAGARGLVGPGVSTLLKVGGALTIGAIAVSAVVCVSRRHGAGKRATEPRALLAATTARVAPNHRSVPAAKALQLVCEPTALFRLSARELLPAAVATNLAIDLLVFGPVTKLVPLLAPALELFSALQTTLASVRFVRDFETTALGFCVEPAPAATTALQN